jgi:F0F1-type ATP synthase membrane subunit c/vacuolar-type H+-ATPase subunit K
MFPFIRVPFRGDFHDSARRLFKGTHFVGLVMVGFVFLYAFFVLSVYFGFISLNFSNKIGTDILNTLKFTLLLVSLFFYLAIRLFKHFIAWLSAKKYLPVFYLFFATLIIFSLCEAVSIYGLVVFLLSRKPSDFFLFMVISLFYFYSFYPRYEDWERLLNQERPEQ